MTEMYVQMGLALAAVVGIILLIGFFLRKRQGGGSLFRILSYQSFGPRKGIAAMKVGREILLIGVTSADLKLLKTYDENEIDTESVKSINDRIKGLKGIREGLSEHK